MSASGLGSALSAGVRAIPAAEASNAASPELTTFPLRMKRLSALFQGHYTIGPSRAPGFATQLYMNGGGNSTAFYHADIQLAVQTPADPSFPSLGTASLSTRSSSDSGDQLILDFQAVPGAVDVRGRPTHFTWTVSQNSGGSFADGQGSGTMQFIYLPGNKLPRGALAAGKLGVVIRGQVSVNPINSLVW